MPVRPVRLQLSRAKGFSLQKLSRATNGLAAVKVARPSHWGNPWVIGERLRYLIPESGKGPLIPCPPGALVTRELAIKQYRIWVKGCTADIQHELSGKNLACFCKLNVACHADVLLELANA